ncbi:hypothetical protein AAG570_012057 [Ranatra chinensis]|uniref:ASD2 domain-containing protein n=1 Tax=Ranatra chinensis TaxID=642074 RepID=A0ABD0YHN8_9HEMI
MSPTGGRIIDTSNDPPVEKPPAVPTASPVVPSPTPVEKEPKEEVAEDKEEEVCHGQVHEGGLDKEPLSKTLPRNYSLSVAPAKRTSRPPRAQSDPTSTAKSDKKSVSASTQDNLEKSVATVGRTHSEVGDRAKEKSRMSDASSQTTPVPSPPPPQLVATVPARRHLQEEIECEQLSRDLASQLSPSHRLHGILVPGPEVKRSTDYVSGLFRMDVVPRSRNSPVSTSEELMQRLTRKLSVLKSESVAVSEETAVNEALGTTVTERVERVARPQEAAKFRLHVKEVGHITSLLLGLSGRLARAENALLTMPQDHQDRKTLESKRDKLLEQLNEAKQLKANIDKRSESVSSMLYNYLTGEEYTDYDHFINMKSKLLVDSREIAEKIQLGEEQLAALKETLDQVR